jgi:hypothetical protein
MFSSVIISSALTQDHKFIYPYHLLLEANSKLDVCIIGGKPINRFSGTTLSTNKDHSLKDINLFKKITSHKIKRNYYKENVDY